MNTEFRLWPEQASSLAADVDTLFAFLIVTSILLAGTIAGLIVYFAIRYRKHAVVDRTIKQSNSLWMELTWIVIPLLFTLVLFVWGARLHLVQRHSPADAMKISCVGRQWMWKFQHPNGRAEINELHVPLGRSIEINMISEDVIHSLYFPAFRTKQDVLPGRYSTLWFQSTQVGQFHLFCAEYCGAKHSGMVGIVHVMTPADYQAWLSGQNPADRSGKPGRLFDQMRCNSCHRGGGETSRGPALQNLLGSKVVLDNGKTVIADADYLRESILRPDAKLVAGYQPLMPSFEGQITEEGILQLIAEMQEMGQSAVSSESFERSPKTVGPDQSPTPKIPEKD